MTEEERKWKKEVKIDRVKREGKTPESLGFLSEKRKGVEVSSTLPQSDSWDQCNIQHKVHWGGLSPVLLTESTPVLQGSHHSVHYCVRLREEEKKEEGAEGGKKTCLFVWEGLSRKVILWLFEFASKAKALPPDLQQHLVHSACLYCLYTRVTYECASQAGKQRHPGFSWWWDPTSEWFPWILMWRIVCFIEEQKEARWLPFRIC